MRRGYKLLVIFTAFLCTLTYLAYLLIDLNTYSPRQNIQTFEEFEKTSDKNFINSISLVDLSREINASDCILAHLDPWDFRIRSFLKPDTNPLKACKIEFRVRSFITDDERLILKDVSVNEKCSYRCLYSIDDWNLKFGKWLNVDQFTNDSSILEARPECDVFDVRCNITNKISYKYMHSHIYEKKYITSYSTIPDSQSFSVHIIVIDSVSMPQAYRSLPMTIHFIQSEMNAIPMPFLNKVGSNSRPNGYAFLLNERALNLSNNPWGNETLGGRDEELCQKSLTDETFIGYDFTKSGYKTLINEDWSTGIFNWPNCVGFTEPPVDHFLKPFMLRIDRKNYTEPDYTDILFKKVCRERHHHILKNLRNFLLKYQNQPKFSINWITDLAHDDPNGLYHSDIDFREFFREMMSNLKNSFVFLMGDHGGRVGDIRNTEVGEFEENNPFLFVILPEILRSNKDLIDQLQINSKTILSHYDLYATFLEIAAKSTNWTSNTQFSTLKFDFSERNLKGSSLFHPLKQPRNCNSLFIPFEYCNCQHPSELIDEKEPAIRIGETIVERINKDLNESKYAYLCVNLELDRKFKIRLREYERGMHKNRRIFKIKFRLQPSKGLYEGFVELYGDKIVLITEQFARLNLYKEQAFCIPQIFLRNYCFCRSLLNVKSRANEKIPKLGRIYLAIIMVYFWYK